MDKENINNIYQRLKYLNNIINNNDNLDDDMIISIENEINEINEIITEYQKNNK